MVRLRADNYKVAKSTYQRNADRLFAALEACGPGWHSRKAIAQQINKRLLTSYDAVALELLVIAGRIEAEQREIDGPIPVRWEYRIKGSTEQ